MHYSTMKQAEMFVAKYLDKTKPLSVLDVGSYNVNGTYKYLFENIKDWTYTGLDVSPGPNVDIVAKDSYHWDMIKDQTYDCIICGSTFEHVEFVWLLIEEIKRVLKIGGVCLITAPSAGPEHFYPLDCWRFYVDGFEALAKWARLTVLEVDTHRDDNPIVDKLHRDTWMVCRRDQ